MSRFPAQSSSARPSGSRGAAPALVFCLAALGLGAGLVTAAAVLNVPTGAVLAAEAPDDQQARNGTPLASGAAKLAQTALGNLAFGTNQGADRSALPPIPGFRRHGSSYVGHVRTIDGTLVRLVFDARTQTLIGMKVLDAAGASPIERIADEPLATVP